MIKTIIFDFAGVITTSALFPRVAEAFGKRAGVGKEEFYKRLVSKEKDYLIGNITTKVFWERVCKKTDITYSEFAKEISGYEINDDVLDLLKILKKNYKLVLLSDSYYALYQSISDDKKLQDIFEHSLFSHQIHLVKMYDCEEVFRFALEKINAKPKDCVFIDDKEINLIPAKNLGINTILFKEIIQLKKELTDLGVKCC